MRQLKSILIILLLCSLASCASPYEKFYSPVSTSWQAIPPSGEPRLVAMSADSKKDILSLYEQGYGLIGTSSFTAPAINQNEALQQAKKIGAEIVVVNSKYLRTVNGAMPITTPTTSTSYTNGNASAYGSGGYASGTYSGMTTTYGSQTNYVPYSVDRYQHDALYFAPLPRTGMGVYPVPASDEQKQKAGTNKLVLIAAVRKGSPSFENDVLAGDILLSINDKPVADLADLKDMVDKAKGATIKLALIRDNKRITKKFLLPDTW